jgi:hypothetical protein
MDPERKRIAEQQVVDALAACGGRVDQGVTAAEAVALLDGLEEEIERAEVPERWDGMS